MTPPKSLDTEINDFVQAIGQLIRRRRAAAGSHDLSLTQTMVMAHLDRHGPATIADLARADGVKPQSMGATIAALEEMGMIERTPHPTDGRQMYIQLTASGAEVRNSVNDAKRMWLAHAVAQLDERDRETLFAAGEIIKRLAES